MRNMSETSSVKVVIDLTVESSSGSGRHEKQLSFLEVPSWKIEG